MIHLRIRKMTRSRECWFIIITSQPHNIFWERDDDSANSDATKRRRQQDKSMQTIIPLQLLLLYIRSGLRVVSLAFTLSLPISHISTTLT